MEMMYSERKPLVLIVDDDEINLLVIEKILGQRIEAATCQSGNEALDYLAARSVDLVILDYNMPDLDGLEVLKHMEQSRVRHEIERGRGTQFDPLFAEIMLQMIDEDVFFQMKGTENGVS